MRITLLGTGAADGWPNPFCDCSSCVVERSAGRVRRPSAALIDGLVLLDSGPTAPYARGISLRDIEHLLVTHGHPDHLHPALLLTRSWTDVQRTLHVWGPSVAIESCRSWIGPNAPVELHVVAPADELRLPTRGGDYSVRVLAAEHHHGDGDALAVEALLYVVTAPDGHRMLYATDTGPLPASTIAAIGDRVDAALLDETFGDATDHGHGHLDLSTLPEVVEALRWAGVADDRTIISAIHLGHHNPPTSVLRDRLAQRGVQVLDDLDVVDTAYPGGRRPTRTLVLGGARSGKSSRAEALAASFIHVDYVATGGERADDSEWVDRVEQHRARRPAHWITHETDDPAAVLRAAEPGACVLVDCLTLWLTSVLDGNGAWRRAIDGEWDGIRADVDRAANDLIRAVEASQATVVLVSNEVGQGVVPGSASGRLFVDLLGRLNTQVGDACDGVTLMVAGRALALPTPAEGRIWM